jgi:ferric-dicitrate binding protein FerR (iron transport regulator)
MSDPQKLIAACLDDALSDDQRDELVAWLKAHPDHLRAFVEANLFEQQIRHAVHGQVQREAAMPLVESGDSLQPQPHRLGEEIPRSWFYRLWLRLVTAGAMARAVALAACLVVLASGFALWLKRPSANGTTSTAVAMLTRAVDARWGQNTGPLRVGSALEPGWLRLGSGLAQVVFYSGARVVIEGPTELQLVSPGEAVCPSGRLLAEVPQPARGFRLRTDQLTVVDLGTAFGINAVRGQTEIHVFEGKVELLGGTAAKQSLAGGEAAAVQKGTPLRLMAASAAAFTSLFEFRERSLASEAFRYEQWQFASTQLNQDPSLLVRLDFENLNGMDWTLRNAAEKNRSVLEATVVGCQRGEGRWREKQAIEFQSVNDRVRLAVPGEFEALTLSAWVCLKGLDRQFNSLFMCDGFEPGTIHWLIRNDGVLGLTVFGPEPGKLQITASPPVLALDRLGMWLHLAVVVDGQAGRVVHYLNGMPVSQHALKLSPPFRIGPAELGNWNVRSSPNPAPNLIRNLSGALDEFAVFSRALTDAEVRDLYFKGQPDA